MAQEEDAIRSLGLPPAYGAPAIGQNKATSIRNASQNPSEEMLARLTARRRAIVKLRLGRLPLSVEEMEKVLPEMRDEAKIVKPRSLRGVAVFFGVSKERIRQIENRAYETMGLETPMAENG